MSDWIDRVPDEDAKMTRQARYLLALYLLAESHKLLQGAWRALHKRQP